METGDGSTNSGGRSLRCNSDADVPIRGAHAAFPA